MKKNKPILATSLNLLFGDMHAMNQNSQNGDQKQLAVAVNKRAIKLAQEHYDKLMQYFNCKLARDELSTSATPENELRSAMSKNKLVQALKTVIPPEDAIRFVSKKASHNLRVIDYAVGRFPRKFIKLLTPSLFNLLPSSSSTVLDEKILQCFVHSYFGQDIAREVKYIDWFVWFAPMEFMELVKTAYLQIFLVSSLLANKVPTSLVHRTFGEDCNELKYIDWIAWFAPNDLLACLKQCEFFSRWLDPLLDREVSASFVRKKLGQAHADKVKYIDWFVWLLPSNFLQILNNSIFLAPLLDKEVPASLVSKKLGQAHADKVTYIDWLSLHSPRYVLANLLRRPNEKTLQMLLPLLDKEVPPSFVLNNFGKDVNDKMTYMEWFVLNSANDFLECLSKISRQDVLVPLLAKKVPQCLVHEMFSQGCSDEVTYMDWLALNWTARAHIYKDPFFAKRLLS